MDINILVGPVYERQRTRSTDISEPDVNQTLCVPMGMHIGMAACTQACLASTRPLSASRPPFGTPTDRSLCHISVALSDRWISTFSLGLPMNANEHNQLTSPNLMSTIPY